MTDELVTAEHAFRRAVGKRLKQARKECGLSIDQVAKHLGLSRATIGHWETGQNPVDLGRLYLLARKYGVSPASLLVESPADQSTTVWPLNLIAPDQWDELDDREKGAIDHAAKQALRDVLAARPSKQSSAALG